MRAIQIFDVNRELIEAWGEKEELTWANSFGSLVGSVLVVDDALPQGYAVKTASGFINEYLWWTNYGTLGWSDIKRVSDMEAERESVLEEEPSYLAFARANVKNGESSSPTIVRELLARIDRDTKRGLSN